MNNNTMPSRTQWTATEDAIFRQMDAAGATNTEIAAALPARSVGAVRRRRQEVIGKRPRHGKNKPASPIERRIATLEATVTAAMHEKRVDWDLVDEYLGGLESLRRRGGVRG